MKKWGIMGKLHLEDYGIKCIGCKKYYDLREITREADRKGKRYVYCPNCGKRVGRIG